MGYSSVRLDRVDLLDYSTCSTIESSIHLFHHVRNMIFVNVAQGIRIQDGVVMGSGRCQPSKGRDR